MGRRPNVNGLGLEAAGVQSTDKGIPVNDWLQTNVGHIYAVGDCNGGPQFTHWAEAEGRIATRNILFRGSERRAVENIPWVTFTEPEVARIGLTLEEATERGVRAHAHTVPFTKVDRAVCFGNAGGFLKVVVDESDLVLGVQIIGVEAGELLPEWVLAMKCGLTLGKIGSTIHAYPTLNRANRRVADEAFYTHNIAGWKKSLFGTYRGRTLLPAPWQAAVVPTLHTLVCIQYSITLYCIQPGSRPMETRNKSTTDKVLITAIVGLMAVGGIALFADDYYELDADDGMAAHYGVAFNEVERVSVAKESSDDAAEVTGATVTEVLDDDVFIATSTDRERVLVMHERPEQDRVADVRKAPEVGDRIDGDGHFEALDEKRLIANGIDSRVLARTTLPEKVFIADDVRVK